MPPVVRKSRKRWVSTPKYANNTLRQPNSTLIFLFITQFMKPYTLGLEIM